MPSDCGTGRCEDSICASCGDTRRSGAESDVDCGGPCADCADGRACGGDDDCDSGHCGTDGRCFSCSSGQHVCNAACVSNAAVATCGASCSPCATPSNGDATCDGTSCGFNCDPGYHACGAECAPDDDATRCGASCTTCPTPANGSASCTDGACEWTCNVGFHRCGSSCSTAPCTWDRLSIPLEEDGSLSNVVIAADPAGPIHMLAVENPGGAARVFYGAWDGQSWTTDTSYPLGGTTDIHIAALHVDATHGVVAGIQHGAGYTPYTARWSGSTWTETAVPGGDAIYGLASTPSGELWVGFKQTPTFSPHVGRLDPTPWQVERVYDPYQATGDALQVDGAGRLVALHHATTSGSTNPYQYSVRTTGGWVNEALGGYRFLQMAHDRVGHAHFCWYDGDGVHYQARVNGSMQPAETLTTDSARWCRVLVAPGAQPFVVATRSLGGFSYEMSVFQKLPGGTWHEDTIGATSGWFSNAVFDAAGRLVVVSTDSGSPELIIAR